MCTLGCPNKFVELYLDCLGVASLGVLDQEDHQKCDDRRTRVDDQLPCVAKVKYRSGDNPGHDDQDRENEYSRASAEVRGSLSES